MPETPEYIQILQSQFEAETQAFKKVHRLIDLSEAVIKFHTVVIVSNFMESMTKSLKSEEDVTTARGILSQGLKTPSLGIWAFFTEKIHPLIPKEDLFWEDFPAYFEKTLKKASAEIIPFRNNYAHGSTPDDRECLEDIKKIYPHVEKILKGGVIDRDVLQVGELLKGTKRSHVVMLQKEGRSLVLSPLLVYRESEKGVPNRSLRLSKGTTEIGFGSGSSTQKNPFPVVREPHQPVEGTDMQNSNTVPSSGVSRASTTGMGLGSGSNTNKRFFYFNDLRNEKKISLLNYEASEHIRDEDLKKAFDEVFPLKSWEKKSVSPFKARIEELTENFKGRREELKQLEGFFREKTKGHFFIWGGPGIGKSTLVARAFSGN